MQISGVNLALTWSHRLCWLRVLLCRGLCYRLSPFQALGKVTLPPHCQACVFIYSSCGGWVFPPLLCSFPPIATSQAFLLLLTGRCCCFCWPPCLFTIHVGSGSSLLTCGVFLPPPLSQASPLLVAGCAPRSYQRLSGLPGLFIYSPGKDSLPPIFSTQGAPPSFQHVLIVLIAYYSVSLFLLGGGQSVQEAMLLWPRIVCEGTLVP
jgi:hypothetical protein